MITVDIQMFFPKGYIGDPYWPEVARLIDIQKISGMNRTKSAANKRKALEGHLQSIGMTLADYEELELLSKRPFYTDDEGLIIIPENHVTSFLVATCDEARSKQRPCDPKQVRSRFACSAWATGKDKADGIFERFATVTSGTGQSLSNQRGLRRSAYIEKFTATGRMEFDETFVDPKTLRQAIEWGGQQIGIGASRKMGWGRFQLREFSQ